jgi:hypothetical protein
VRSENTARSYTHNREQVFSFGPGIPVSGDTCIFGLSIMPLSADSGVTGTGIANKRRVCGYRMWVCGLFVPWRTAAVPNPKLCRDLVPIIVRRLGWSEFLFIYRSLR